MRTEPTDGDVDPDVLDYITENDIDVESETTDNDNDDDRVLQEPKTQVGKPTKQEGVQGDQGHTDERHKSQPGFEPAQADPIVRSDEARNFPTKKRTKPADSTASLVVRGVSDASVTQMDVDPELLVSDSNTSARLPASGSTTLADPPDAVKESVKAKESKVRFNETTTNTSSSWKMSGIPLASLTSGAVRRVSGAKDYAVSTINSAMGYFTEKRNPLKSIEEQSQGSPRSSAEIKRTSSFVPESDISFKEGGKVETDVPPLLPDAVEEEVNADPIVRSDEARNFPAKERKRPSDPELLFADSDKFAGGSALPPARAGHDESDTTFDNAARSGSTTLADTPDAVKGSVRAKESEVSLNDTTTNTSSSWKMSKAPLASLTSGAVRRVSGAKDYAVSTINSAMGYFTEKRNPLESIEDQSQGSPRSSAEIKRTSSFVPESDIPFAERAV